MDKTINNLNVRDVVNNMSYFDEMCHEIDHRENSMIDSSGGATELFNVQNGNKLRT